MTDERLLAIAAARDPIAVSTAQPSLLAFHAEGGFVPYLRSRNTTLTLGAPVGPPEAMGALAAAFVDRFPDATFFYVTEAQRQRMALPFRHAWPAGLDFILPLPAPGYGREVMSAARKARRAGVRFEELTRAQLSALEPQMRRVQASYLEGREVAAEMTFLTRPCLFADERLGRTFALEQGDRFLGFVVLDPYRTASGGQGYLLNLFRIGPTQLWGVYAATVVALADRLQAEGAQELSLGFVPLAPEVRAPEVSWWSRPQLALLRIVAARSGYLRGLLRMKSAFGVRQVPRYVLSRRRFLLPDVRAILGAMGVR